MKSIACSLAVLVVASGVSARADVRETEPHPTTVVQRAEQRSTNAGRPMRALPITMFVLAGAAIVGGAVTLAFDEDPRILPPGQKQPEFYTNTTVPGVLAIASGVVFAGAAGYLYWKFGRVRATPRLSVSQDSATIGFSGTL
jgi:protein-S-isoprenylcysteine O-methyltransferase Ste14